MALLQQIFEVDPLACPTCHGAMRIVACITQAAVIDQILAHLRSRAAAGAQLGRPAARLHEDLAAGVVLVSGGTHLLSAAQGPCAPENTMSQRPTSASTTAGSPPWIPSETGDDQVTPSAVDAYQRGLP
ncbi:MAG: hypothetical protein EXR93_11295 [Gemmatimonadetes bacterium]|nr:hypothetical protein [Gemmatimonadota bacterium]